MALITQQNLIDAAADAQSLQQFANSSSLSIVTRLGLSLKTLFGYTQDAIQILLALGYKPPVAYAGGLAITSMNQTVIYNGLLYAPVAVPYVTPNVFDPAAWYVVVGKASAASRLVLKTAPQAPGAVVFLYEAGRQGNFRWDPTVPVATHQTDALDASGAGEGVYVAPNATANGAWVRQFSGGMRVEWFGAAGNCPDYEDLVNSPAPADADKAAAVAAIAAATNDVGAFVKAARVATLGLGAKITFGGKNYRLAYTSDYPALVLASGTTLEQEGGGAIYVDPSLLPAAAQASPVTGRGALYGGITAGDPFNFTRGSGTLYDANVNCIWQAGTIDESDFTHGIALRGVRLRCVWNAVLTANQRCYGMFFYWTSGMTIRDIDVRGMPCAGVGIRGGSLNTVKDVVVEGCGFYAPGTTSKNGLDLFGFMVLGRADLSSYGWTVSGVRSNFNREEGVSFAVINGLNMSDLSLKGNLDRGIEGDTSYDMSSSIPSDGYPGGRSYTAAVLGQEIPNDVTIKGVQIDGRHRDGVRFTHGGITIGCGNETRVILDDVSVKHCGSGVEPKNDGTGTVTYTEPMIQVSCSDGGRAILDNFLIEDCQVPSNYSCVVMRTEYVTIGSGRVLRTTGGSNSAIFALAGCREVSFTGRVECDAGSTPTANDGFGYAVRFDPNLALVSGYPRPLIPANLLHVRGFDCRRLRSSFVLYNTGASFDRLLVEDNNVDDFYMYDSDDSHGYVELSNAGIIGNELILKRNRGRWVTSKVKPRAPVSTSGDIDLPAGAITKLVAERNDWLGPFKATYSAPRTASNPTNFGSIYDADNGFYGQRTVTGSADPTTGSWYVGDKRVNVVPSNNIAGSVVQSSGTFGALAGVTATTDGATSTVAVNTVAGLDIGQYINIAGGVSGHYRIIDLNATALTIKLDNVPVNTSGVPVAVAGKSVSFQPPVFVQVTIGGQPVYTKATMPTAAAVPAPELGSEIYVTDGGGAGVPCKGVWTGTAWGTVAIGAAIPTS